MGKRGPQPTPLKVLKNRGSARAKRKGKEPKPRKGEPAMPVWLWPEAIRIWHDIVRQLDEMDILGECDGNALARYCQAMARYIDCQDVLKAGSTYMKKTREGNEVNEQRPEVKESKELSEECRKIEMLFGLTPSARTALAPERESSRRENRGKNKPKSKSRFFMGKIG